MLLSHTSLKCINSDSDSLYLATFQLPQRVHYFYMTMWRFHKESDLTSCICCIFNILTGGWYIFSIEFGARHTINENKIHIDENKIYKGYNFLTFLNCTWSLAQ